MPTLAPLPEIPEPTFDIMENTNSPTPLSAARLLNGMRLSRQKILTLLDGLSTEQINRIPPGFNNNIAWNLGHVIAVQQSITYTRAGLVAPLSQDFISRYMPGTRPQGDVTAEEVNEMKSLLMTTVDRMEGEIDTLLKDHPGFSPGNFAQFAAQNISEVINILTGHDGAHFGYCTALRRLVA